MAMVLLGGIAKVVNDQRFDYYLNFILFIDIKDYGNYIYGLLK